MKAIDHAINDLASAQYGVVTRLQLLEIRCTARQISVRIRSGMLVPVHQGVYVTIGSSRTPQRTLLAACLAGGPTAVASHRSAAHLWELRGIDAPAAPEITLPRSLRRKAAVRATTVHTTDRLDVVDRDERDGIPVTSAARTLVDLGAVLPRHVEAALEDALHRGYVTCPWMWRTVGRLGGHGRRGVGVLRPLLEARDPSQAPTESVLEDGFSRLVDRAGIPLPDRQQRIEGLRVDFVWAAARIIVEVDGRRWHEGEAGRRNDRRRDNRLIAAGWRVLRFTWNDIRYSPEVVVAELLAALTATTNVLVAG